MRKTLLNFLFFLILTILLVLNFAIPTGSLFLKIIKPAMASQKKVIELITKNEKSPDDIAYIRKSIAISQEQAYRLAFLTKKLSSIVPLGSTVVLIDALASFSSQLPQLLGDGADSNFVLLFLNNYELRPGGGFIGSLGFVTLRDYTITRFEIQDVYEIDGQITTHHEPHYAVRKYLNQPNEFLRDSNFSPDFSVGAKKAIQHLSRVPAYSKPYMAVIGITTTAFEKLLSLTGPIQLADYNTTITSSNFFTTTQRKIETEFFPGSKQKRLILQSLGNIMRQRIEQLSYLDIFEYIRGSVRTKDLVFFTSNNPLQNLFVLLDAAGIQKSGPNDWIMPVDANVGVNKIDALINKTMELQLLRQGAFLTHTFKSTYTNSITADALEKEIYRNYFQLYVPNRALIKKVILNNKDVTREVIITQEIQNAVLGLYFEVPPASSATISVTYILPQNHSSDQIQFQKQIGSKSSPLTVIYRGNPLKIIQTMLTSDLVFTLL